MNNTKVARMGPKGTGSSHMMTAVLMALMMVFLGGVTAHQDTVDTASTNEQTTTGVTDYRESNGSERRNARKSKDTQGRKDTRQNSVKTLQQNRRKREEPDKKGAKNISNDDMAKLRGLRDKSNKLGSFLRRRHSKRLGISTPEQQAQALSQMVGSGAPLKNWVLRVKLEVQHVLSVPYQIDYIFHAGLQYASLKEKRSDIRVEDLMRAVASVYPKNLVVKERKWDKWSQGLLGKDQKKIQKQYVSQTAATGWATYQKKQESRVAKVVSRLKDALAAEIEAKGEVVEYDNTEKEYSLTFDGQAGNEDSEQLETFNERLKLPGVQLHLAELSEAQSALQTASSEIQKISDSLEEMHKTNPNHAETILSLLSDAVNSAIATRTAKVEGLLKEVRRLYKRDGLKKDDWVSRRKNQVMREFQEKYTPRAWTATCGDISWHFHSGFEVHFAKPVRVKPVTERKGKSITWNVDIDDDGYATVLKTTPGGYLYTVENPMERVKRSHPGQDKTDLEMRIPQGKEYLHQFKTQKRTKNGKFAPTGKTGWFDHVGDVSHPHVTPSHFSGLIGHIGPSNGAFVSRGSEKEGKIAVRGDDYSYSRLHITQVPHTQVEFLLKVDKALNKENDYVGKKLRGWWLQATNKDDVPDPLFGKKRDQELPKKKPKKKANPNRQAKNNKKGNSLDSDVKDIETGVNNDLYRPTGNVSPYQGVDTTETTVPREKREKKGTPVPASPRTSDAPAKIDEGLQPFTEAVDWTAKTVAELKELLKAAGEKTSGNKADLIERLTATGQ